MIVLIAVRLQTVKIAGAETVFFSVVDERTFTAQHLFKYKVRRVASLDKIVGRRVGDARTVYVQREFFGFVEYVDEFFL